MKDSVWILAALVMCVSPTAAEEAARPTPRPLGRELGDPNGYAPGVLESQGRLTLRAALALALAGSPELGGLAAAERAAEARTLQAGLRPNPTLGLEIENVGGSGDLEGIDAAETTLALSQVVELGDKRLKRMRVSRMGEDLAAWDFEAKRLEVLVRTTERFVDTAIAQHRRTIAREDLALTQRVAEAVSQRVAAGALSQLESNRSQVTLASARVATRQAEQTLDAARRALAATWGGTRPRFGEVEAHLDPIRSLPDVDGLAELADQNPAVARWAAEIAQRRAVAEVARADAVPDVELSAGVRRFNEEDDTALVFGMALPLPVFDRNPGGIAEAEAQVTQAELDQRAAAISVRGAIIDTYNDLANAHAEIQILNQESIPAAERSFAGMDEAFRQGKVGYLDVLDAQRTLLELRSQHLDALGRYHHSIAILEGLVGQPIFDPDAVGETAEADISRLGEFR